MPSCRAFASLSAAVSASWSARQVPNAVPQRGSHSHPPDWVAVWTTRKRLPDAGDRLRRDGLLVLLPNKLAADFAARIGGRVNVEAKLIDAASPTVTMAEEQSIALCMFCLLIIVAALIHDVLIT